METGRMYGVVKRMGSFPAMGSGVLKVLRKDDVDIQMGMVACILDAFGDTLSAVQLFSAVASMQAEISEAGYGDRLRERDGEPITPAMLCRDVWCRELHLVERFEEGGIELYRFTAVAQDALRLMMFTGSTRMQLGTSSVTEIQTRVMRLAAHTNPEDEELMHSFLRRRLEEAQEDLERFESEGIVALGPSELAEEVDLLSGTLAQHVSDMSYVRDRLDQEAQKLISDFRRDERPRSEIIGEYLERHDALSNSELGGRCYAGVMGLLSSPKMRREAEAAFEQIERGLPGDERVLSIREGWRRLVSANDSVKAALGKTLLRINNELTRLDSDSIRAYARTVRALRNEIEDRAREGGPGCATPLVLPVRKLQQEDLSPLPAGVAPKPREVEMPPLPQAQEAQEMPADTYRGYSAPRTAEVAAALLEAAGGAEVVDVAELFNTLPAELRRDVEVGPLGALAPAGGDAPEVEWVCVGVDGVQRTWLAPQVMTTASELRRMLEREEAR